MYLWSIMYKKCIQCLDTICTNADTTKCKPFERCQKISKTPLKIYNNSKRKRLPSLPNHQFSCANLLLVSGGPLKKINRKSTWKGNSENPSSSKPPWLEDPGLRSPKGCWKNPPTRQISNCDATWGTRRFTWQLVQAAAFEGVRNP